MSLRRLAPLAVLAAALALPGAAHATAPPTIDVAVGDRAITIMGDEDVGRGPVRLRLSGDSLDGTRTVIVLELRRGIRPDELDRSDIARGEDAAPAERFGRLVAGAQVSRDAEHTTTLNLRARDYLVADITHELGGMATFGIAGERNSARIPGSLVTLGLRDRGLYLPSRLPARGLMRIANQGDLPHQATAYRLRRHVTVAEAVRAAHRGLPLTDYGTPTVLTGLVSRGTVNRVAYDLRRGRYLVVSEYTPVTLGGRSDVDRGLIGATRVR